jgi:threonine dehydrogenase-like Zn-dependent dehydrogenase
MKFLLTLVATLALDYGVSAFTVQQHGALHKNSALQMTTESSVEKKIIKVGVIGAGRIGLVHLEAITKAPGVIPVIISNPTVSKAEAGTSVDCPYLRSGSF